MENFNAEVLYLKLSSTSKDVHQFNKKIGEGIRSIRTNVGLSQSTLAKKSNFCRNTIVKIEVGERATPIPLKTVYKILGALAVQITLYDFLELCHLT